MTQNDKEHLCNVVMFLAILGVALLLFYIKITTETPEVTQYKNSEIRRFEYPEDVLVCYAYNGYKVGGISCVSVKGKANDKK